MYGVLLEAMHKHDLRVIYLTTNARVSVEERILSMRHKSKSTAVDASQSLVTKEGLAHLFGISKARGKAYETPLNYKTVVYERGAASKSKDSVMLGARDATSSEIAEPPTNGANAMAAHFDISSEHNSAAAPQISDSTANELDVIAVDLETIGSEATGFTATEPEAMDVEHEVIDLTFSP